MCHCKTCADRLHVIIVIIAVPYSPASCLIRFPFLHTCIPFTSPRFYALPILHDTFSKNAQLLSATTSFPWHHTNTSKSHGYNAVADDSRREPFRAEDSAPAPDEEGEKGRKGQTFLDHRTRAPAMRGRLLTAWDMARPFKGGGGGGGGGGLGNERTILLLSHSLIFFRFYFYQCIYGFIPVW